MPDFLMAESMSRGAPPSSEIFAGNRAVGRVAFTVAAGHAAGGVDDDGVQRGKAIAVGKAHPQRAGFVDSPTPAAAWPCRDGERDPADGAIAGEYFVA